MQQGSQPKLPTNLPSNPKEMKNHSLQGTIDNLFVLAIAVAVVVPAAAPAAVL